MIRPSLLWSENYGMSSMTLIGKCLEKVITPEYPLDTLQKFQYSLKLTECSIVRLLLFVSFKYFS